MKNIFTALFLLSSISSPAQFGLQWEKAYDDSLHHDNYPAAITFNNAGCLIVTGSTTDSVLTTTQMRTIKYDASGNVLWQADYAPPSLSYFPTDITTDTNGNIFISTDVFDGTSLRFHVLKYDCSGSLMWDAVSPTIRFYVNLSKRIALDGHGNIYVGATSDCLNCYAWAQGNYGEATVIKFDSNGNYVTEMRTGQTGIFQLYYSATPYSSFLTDMEMATSKKNIYSITNLNQDSAAFYNEPNLEDFALLKYDTAGTITFLKRIWRPAKEDYPVDLFIGTNEDVFITGWTKDTSANAKNKYLTAKLDSAGNIHYVIERGDTAWSSEGASIAVDGLGNAYVAGRTFEYGTTADIELIKYDPNGNEVWVQTYNSAFNDWDNPVANSIHIDAQANIYVNAYSHNGNNYDFLVLKYDSSGSLIGEYRYNGASNQDDYPVEMTVNTAGEIFNTGSSKSSNGNDYLTVKFGFPTFSTGDSLCSTVGVKEFSNENIFSIYPNPANQLAKISWSRFISGAENKNAEIKIFDISGREVFSNDLQHSKFNIHHSTFQIDISLYENGIYFVKLVAGHQTAIKKLIIQH